MKHCNCIIIIVCLSLSLAVCLYDNYKLGFKQRKSAKVKELVHEQEVEIDWSECKYTIGGHFAIKE